MFSPLIVESEEFLMMPVSSQALYFHLGMNADDDGFIQPKIVMRTTGANDDDLKVLLTKRFLLAFESGVVVVKHWLIHNLIQKDRYHPTRFQEEKKALIIKDNKSYSDSVNKMLPEVRLGKDRLLGADKPRIDIVPDNEDNPKKEKTPQKYPNARVAFSWFPKPQKSWDFNTTELKCGELLFERGEKQVKAALAFCLEHRDEEFFSKVVKPSDLERKWLDIIEYKRKNGY